MNIFKGLIALPLFIVTMNANALLLNFNDADNGTSSFSLISGGLTYTFDNPSTDSTFTIESNQLLFGHPPGANSSPDLTQFTLTVSGGDGVFTGYSTASKTQSGDTFNITGSNTNNQYDDLQGSSASLNSFTTALVLLENEIYTFDYNLSATNPSGSGITGLAGIDVAPSAVPVPAAVWLLGSALLGLSRFRKKG